MKNMWFHPRTFYHGFWRVFNMGLSTTTKGDWWWYTIDWDIFSRQDDMWVCLTIHLTGLLNGTLTMRLKAATTFKWNSKHGLWRVNKIIKRKNINKHENIGLISGEICPWPFFAMAGDVAPGQRTPGAASSSASSEVQRGGEKWDSKRGRGAFGIFLAFFWRKRHFDNFDRDFSVAFYHILLSKKASCCGFPGIELTTFVFSAKEPSGQSCAERRVYGLQPPGCLCIWQEVPMCWSVSELCPVASTV